MKGQRTLTLDNMFNRQIEKQSAAQISVVQAPEVDPDFNLSEPSEVMDVDFCELAEAMSEHVK